MTEDIGAERAYVFLLFHDIIGEVGDCWILVYLNTVTVNILCT